MNFVCGIYYHCVRMLVILKSGRRTGEDVDIIEKKFSQIVW